MPDIFDALEGEPLPTFLGSQKLPQTFIMEMSAEAVYFLAHTAHIYMSAHPNSEQAKKTLIELMEQTDVVSMNPKTHGIHESIITMPPHSKTFPPVVYTPIDHA